MRYSQVGVELTVDLEHKIVFEPSDILVFGPTCLRSANADNFDAQMPQTQ